MKTLSRFALINLVLFLCCSTLLAQSPKREFRGVWLSTVTNIDWPSSPGLPAQTQKDQLVNYLNRLTAEGFNAVVLQVRPECDALYQSSIEPWSYWLTGVQGGPPNPLYDPLQFAVEEAHKRGLELHAWFNPYRAERVIGSYPLAPTHVVKQHPDWILTIGTIRILDPGKQAVRNYVAGVIADVVRRYDVDGAHMDDYFYAEGITTQDAATFQAEPRGFTNLGDWRRDNVNLLIRQIYDSVKAIKPWVKWGMSPAGIWRDGVPPGTRGNDNYSVIYCDALAWLQGQYIDYIAPQLYWRFGGSQDYGLLQPWWSSQRNGRDLYPGLATYRIGQSNFGSASEIANQIRFNRSTGNTQGNIQFTAHYITTDNVGGIADTLTRDLYRYKALLPVMKWKDSIPPNPIPNIRYERLAGPGPAALQWDLPPRASDGDSASRYVVYRFDHSPILPGELDASRNILQVEGRRYSTPAPPPTLAGPYYFVVTALDRNYNESQAGPVLAVSPPATPVLASPAGGTLNLPPSIPLSWYAPATASVYRLQVSTDQSFASGLAVNDSTIVDTVRVVAGLKGQQTYYWRVVAGNAGGTGQFSASRSFTTGFPATPLLAAPANYSPRAATNMYFRWRQAQAATTYRFQLAEGSDFAAAIVDTSSLVDTSFTVNGLQLSKIYFWRVRASNSIGVTEWSEIWRFRTDTVATAIAEGQQAPSQYGLSQNYPNPFNPNTIIHYQLPVDDYVSLRVYDVLGREVAVLVDETQAAGSYQVRFSASGLSSGIYFYRLIAGGFVDTKKMQLVK